MTATELATAPAGSPTRWWDRLRTLRLGLLGQALTFVAMVAPIALRETDKITSLVFTTAIATFLVNPAVLAYPYVYPVLRSERMAATATRLSLGCLLLVALALLPLGLLEPRWGLPRGTVAAAAGLLVAQGGYLVALTRLVRDGDERLIGRARFHYGLGVLAATGIALLPGTGALALTTANTVAFGGTAIALTWGRRGRSGARAYRSRRVWVGYLRRSGHPTLSSAASGWAFLLPGLSLPGLGTAAAPWAVLNRICGGFATVLLTIVGPPMEATLARAVRTRDRVAFARTRRSALLLGAAVAAVALVTGLLLAGYAAPDTLADWWLPVGAAALLFWGPLLALSVVNRLPNFLGRDTARLGWDIARALGMSAAFLTTDGALRLVVMGLVVTLFGGLLLPMSRWDGAR